MDHFQIHALRKVISESSEQIMNTRIPIVAA